MTRQPPIDAVCVDCDVELDVDYQDRILAVTADGDVITELVCPTHMLNPLESQEPTP